MKYKNVVKGTFIERPNRFIAKVDIDGNIHTVHVKNTGRCRELLIKGSTVYLAKSDNLERKTLYDLIAVEKKYDNKEPLLINMDSQVPNVMAEEFLIKGNLFSENAIIKREVTYKNSRFDLYIEDNGRKAFLEVKGVTLESDGIAMFPDAPTIRGVKHINELISAIADGYEAYILFVIQMKGVKLFKPNAKMHKEFADVLSFAKKNGVKVLAVDSIVTKDSIEIDSFIKTEV